MNASVVAFPRERKRGPKVKKGPIAELKDFPLLSGHALGMRLSWLLTEGRRWHVEHLPDEEDLAEHAQGGGDLMLCRYRDNYAEMRKAVAEAEQAILQRAEIKSWLRARGRDADTADEAAVALFEMLQAERCA